jgi:hypothetical protein
LHSSHTSERRLLSLSLPSHPILDNTIDCNDLNACKFKIQGSNNCDGTVAVSCGNELRFYYDASGNPTFNTPAQADDHVGGRALMETEEDEEASAAREDEFLSSLLFASGVANVADVASSVRNEGVEDGTSGSGLRGTRGSKRIL